MIIDLFDEILNEANSESRVQFLLKRYKDILEENGTDADRFIPYVVYEIDPTKGEYSDWIVRTYLKCPPHVMARFDQDDYKIRSDLELYHKYKRFLKETDPELMDINKIKGTGTETGFDKLYGIVRWKLDAIIHMEEDKEALRLQEKHVEKIYNSKNFLILIPKTKEASCAYGRGTRWCTAATGSHNWFDSYNSEGPLYIIIDRINDTKYQFHFQSNQFMDEEDRQLFDNMKDVEGFFEDKEELKIPLIIESLKNNNIKFAISLDSELAISECKKLPEEKIKELLEQSLFLTIKWGVLEPDFVNSIIDNSILEFSDNYIYYYVDDWNDVTNFIGNRDKHAYHMAIQIIQGDYDYFDSYVPDYDSYMLDWVDKNSFELVKEYIENTYEKSVSNMKEAIDIEEENDGQELKDALSRSMSRAEESAHADAMYKEAISPITDVLGKSEWINGKLRFSLNKRDVVYHIENAPDDEDHSGAPLKNFDTAYSAILDSLDALENPDFERVSRNAYADSSTYGPVFNEAFQDEINVLL